MGLMAALKRFHQILADGWLGPHLTRDLVVRVAELVRQDPVMLERAVAGASYQLIDIHDYQCRVVTSAFTVTFTWEWRDQQLVSGVRVHESHNHPLDLLYPHLDYPPREWLRAQGLPTLPHRSGPISSTLVRDELESVGAVVAQILSDDRKVREALFYLRGDMAGYNDRVLVPEEAPPKFVADWTEERLRLRELRAEAFNDAKANLGAGPKASAIRGRS
jgi:hypothetical protein